MHILHPEQILPATPRHRTPETQPAAPEYPWIRVREHEETGETQAVFALELTGVMRLPVFPHAETATVPPPDAVPSPDACLAALLAGLAPGQQLTFVYANGRTPETPEAFVWRIFGLTAAATREAAAGQAADLWRNVAVSLASIDRAYRFTPVSLPDKEHHPLFPYSALRTPHSAFSRVLLQPSGVAVVVPSRRLGFTPAANQTPSSAILAPCALPGHPSPLEAMVTALSRYPAPVSVSLSVTPITLSPAHRRAIAEAVRWLNNDTPKTIRYQPDIDGAQGQEALQYLTRNLERWMQYPSGYRISCRIASTDPIPASLCALVGHEVFPGQPLSIQTEHEAACNEDRARDVLDLRGALHPSTGLPAVFPAVSALNRLGVGPVYPQPPKDLPATGIALGRLETAVPGQEVRFARVDRTRHCFLMGATGAGKSTLLFNMILQDIHNGEGVCLIDPHGDLFRQVLRAIPEQRAAEVILVDAADFHHAVGVNFLEVHGPYRAVQMNFVVNEMLKIFDRLYDMRIAGGPMFETYMRNALLLAMDNAYAGGTLVDVPWIFEDRDYRDFLKQRCRNPYVVNFWSKQAERAGGETSLSNMAPYITSKLNQFTMNALLRPIIGQSQSTIDFRQAMDEGRILLVNLAKGYLGELDCKLLGMLLIGKLFSAAMGRSDIPPDRRRPFFLYVDEFQNFTTDTMAYLLSEARKFGLALTLANQNLAQLTPHAGSQSILEAVLGNVGTMLLFRMGTLDAHTMQKYTLPDLEAQTLQTLPDFHVAGRLLTRRGPSRPVVFQTRPPIPTDPDPSLVDQLVRFSNQQYTRPIQEVESEILRRKEKALEMYYGEETQGNEP
jgi:hypothetical protein